jgi:hypothetical protein
MYDISRLHYCPFKFIWCLNKKIDEINFSRFQTQTMITYDIIND